MPDSTGSTQRIAADRAFAAPTGKCERPGPFRLDIFTSDVGDTVGSVGGWMYDQAIRGWRVTVILTNPADPRPLRILGVDTVDLDSASTIERPSADLLCASCQLVESDLQTRQLFRSGLTNSNTDVALWGRQAPPSERRIARRVKYQPTRAASAFKYQALLAVGAADPSPEAAEKFWYGIKSSFVPVDTATSNRSTVLTTAFPALCPNR